MGAAFVRRVVGILVVCDDEHHCDIPPPSALVDGGDRSAMINITVTSRPHLKSLREKVGAQQR